MGVISLKIKKLYEDPIKGWVYLQLIPVIVVYLYKNVL